MIPSRCVPRPLVLLAMGASIPDAEHQSETLAARSISPATTFPDHFPLNPAIMASRKPMRLVALFLRSQLAMRENI